MSYLFIQDVLSRILRVPLLKYFFLISLKGDYVDIMVAVGGINLHL
jgi:hypothetical protein